MADNAKKPLAEGDNLGVESTTLSPETEIADDCPQGDAVKQPADDDEPSDEQAAAENGNLSEAGGRYGA